MQTPGSKPIKSWTRPAKGEETTSYKKPVASDNSFTLGDFKLVPSRNSRGSQKSLKVAGARVESKDPVVLRNLLWPLNEEGDAPNISSPNNNDDNPTTTTTTHTPHTTHTYVLSHNTPNISAEDKYDQYETSDEEVKVLGAEVISEFIFSGPPRAHFALQGEWSELPPVRGDYCVKKVLF